MREERKKLYDHKGDLLVCHNEFIRVFITDLVELISQYATLGCFIHKIR